MVNAYSAEGFVAVILLIICSTAYLRTTKRLKEMFLKTKKGILYKASVIGIRLHYFVSISCFLLAGYITFS
ncbi:protein kish-b [Anaeramoeba ignava]|uniref:Protein kish n=1 Tax=Anaeramoeba ignava TaxID=1746090 RepID=A0A9Q0LFW4_ANAIG|nr:protein kish-b [Anaeramoeba ignava]